MAHLWRMKCGCEKGEKRHGRHFGTHQSACRDFVTMSPMAEIEGIFSHEVFQMDNVCVVSRSQ